MGGRRGIVNYQSGKPEASRVGGGGKGQKGLSDASELGYKFLQGQGGMLS